jgi:myo-inositol-1(or 4)-monophosphatase
MDYELASVISVSMKTIGNRLLAFQPHAIKTEGGIKNFVTSADKMCYDLIVKMLKKARPEWQIVSEEDEDKLKGLEEEFWIIDPIDGTINYFHQDSTWGISIALIKKQEVVAGFLCFPAFKKHFSCTKNHTIFSRTKLMRRGDNDLSQAQIWMDYAKESSEISVELFAKLTRATACPQIRLCATYSLMQVATGKIAGYVNPNPKLEDFAAACLFVEKAGGMVTDFEGRPWSPFSKSIVATNGLLHNQLLEVVNS